MTGHPGTKKAGTAARLDFENGLDCFLDEGSVFALAAAQVVQLGTTDTAALDDFDLSNTWTMNGEHTLHTFVVRDAANGESLAQATTAISDHDTSEDLDTFLVTFDDSAMNLHGIARTELGEVLLHLLFGNLGDGGMHSSVRVKNESPA